MRQKESLGPEDIRIITSLRSDSALLHSEQNHAFSKNPPAPSQFYISSYHRDRLLAAARDFQWGPAIKVLEDSDGVAKLEKVLRDALDVEYHDSHYPQPLKASSDIAVSVFASMPTDEAQIRIDLDERGNFSTTLRPCTCVPSSAFFPLKLEKVPPPDTLVWTIYLSKIAFPITLYTQHKTSYRLPYDQARAQLASTDLQTEILLQNMAGEIMEGTLTTPYFWREGGWVTPASKCGGNRGTTRRWALERGLCTEGVIKADMLIEEEVIWLSNGVRGFGWGRLALNVATSVS